MPQIDRNSTFNAHTCYHTSARDDQDVARSQPQPYGSNTIAPYSRQSVPSSTATHYWHTDSKARTSNNSSEVVSWIKIVSRMRGRLM